MKQLTQEDQAKLSELVQTFEEQTVLLKQASDENVRLKRQLANAQLAQKAAADNPEVQQQIRETVQKMASANFILPANAPQILDMAMANPIGTFAQILQKAATAYSKANQSPVPMGRGAGNVGGAEAPVNGEKPSEAFWREKVQQA